MFMAQTAVPQPPSVEYSLASEEAAAYRTSQPLVLRLHVTPSQPRDRYYRYKGIKSIQRGSDSGLFYREA